MFSGPASRCVRSPDNRARQGDSDRKDGCREARTFAKKTANRAAGESSGRLSDQPPGRKLKAHRSVRCDRVSDISWDVPFRCPGRTIEMMRALRQSPVSCRRAARMNLNGEM